MREIGVQVADLSAGAADQMVVGVLDVGIEPGGAGPDVERRHLAHCRQLVKGLVHGLQ